MKLTELESVTPYRALLRAVQQPEDLLSVSDLPRVEVAALVDQLRSGHDVSILASLARGAREESRSGSSDLAPAPRVAAQFLEDVERLCRAVDLQGARSRYGSASEVAPESGLLAEFLAWILDMGDAPKADRRAFRFWADSGGRRSGDLGAVLTLMAPLDVESAAWASAAGDVAMSLRPASADIPFAWIAALARVGSTRLARLGGSESALQQRLVDAISRRLPAWTVETEQLGAPDIVISRERRRIGIEVKAKGKTSDEIATLQWERWQRLLDALVVVTPDAPLHVGRPDRITFVTWRNPLDNDSVAQAIVVAAETPPSGGPQLATSGPRAWS